MGLPQELVGHVMDMLCDDILALKACSLTCKAMFASTRHLIHGALKLGQKNTLRAELRLISSMDERGLLQYVRRVHICAQYSLTPEILLPHLHYFQLLNQVHTLTIDHFCPDRWNYDSTSFSHLYPTPTTSLTLHHPRNHDQLLNFVLHFPNLENLSLQWLRLHGDLELSLTDITTPERTPPLRGCLRLVGYYGVSAQPSTALFCEPPTGFNFRSVELYENFPESQARNALNACARTLEILTIVKVHSLGNLRLPFLPSVIADRFCDPSIDRSELQLTEMAVLRRLTLRMAAFSDLDIPLVRMLSTIVSPAFCEFVLELGGSSPLPGRESMEKWGPWRDFDNLVEDNFATNRDFRFIIKTSEPPDWEELRKRAEQGFPLLAGRGCIYLETL